MKTALRVLGALLLLSACDADLPHQNPFDPQAPASLQAPATITGRVALEGGADPTGTQVAAQGTSSTALAASDGSFALSGLKAGVYQVVAVREGFVSARLGGVRVEIGQTVDLGELRLEERRGVLRGEISLRGATDNAGATVSLLASLPLPPETGAEEGAGRSFAAVSSSNGYWEMEVPAGQYYLLVRKEGYQPSCGGLITLVWEQDEKSIGLIELVSTSALVSFATAEGLALEPSLVGGEARTFTRSQQVKVRLGAAGAVAMRSGWSDEQLAEAAFVPYAVESRAVLPGEEDGERTFSLELRDQCGLVQGYVASITLDRTAPAGSAVIADGAAWLTTADGNAPVRLSASDALSGVRAMRLSTDGTDPVLAPELPYQEAMVLPFGAADGAKALRALFYDLAGNVSTEVRAEIEKDSTAPLAGATAAQVLGTESWAGRSVVCGRQAQLAFDVTGADEMSVSRTSGGGQFVPFAAQTTVDLSSDPAGALSFFVRFRDRAGNQTPEYAVGLTRESSGSLRGTLSFDEAADATQAVVSLDGGSPVYPQASGEFGFEGVEEGVHEIEARTPGFRARREVVLVRACREAQTSLSLSRATGTLAGTATLQGGASHAGIAVTLAPVDGVAAPRTQTTGPAGAWTFERIPTGEYWIYFAREGWRDATAGPVQVAEDQTVAVPAVVLDAAPGRVEGRVQLELPENVAIQVGLEGGAAATVDEQGSYAIDQVTPGARRVVARAVGFRSASVAVQVVADQTTQAEPLFLWRERGAVAGTVQLVGAASHDGVLVVLERRGQRWATSTAPSGEFRLESVPTAARGEYELTLSKDGYLSKKLVVDEVAVGAVMQLAPQTLERMTGAFNFLHCSRYSGAQKQLVALLGGAYLQECGDPPRVRLELSPPPGTTAFRWSLGADFAAATEALWDPAGAPPEIALDAASGTRTVRVWYRVPGSSPEWSDPFSAALFVDREPPRVDELRVLNDPPYLTPGSTWANLRLRASDPASGAEPGSGPGSYALVLGDQACPAAEADYGELPTTVETGLPLSFEAVAAPDTEPEGGRAVRVCVRDQAGNLADAVTEAGALVFDRQPPQAAAFYFARGTDLAQPVAQVRERDLFLVARVSTEFAPLSGVAFASRALDCATAIYETPELDPPTPTVAGERRDYRVVKGWQLSGDDGAKQGFVCLEDQAGNRSSSPIATDAPVLLDTTPPATCGLNLPGNGRLFAARDLAVGVNTEAGAEALLGGDLVAAGAGFAVPGAWTALASLPPSLRLSDGDGSKTLTVTCRDALGNAGLAASTSVTLDRTAPELPTLQIAEGDYTRTQRINLSLFAIGASQVTLEVLGSGLAAQTVPYAASTQLDLPATRGAWTVQATFRDAAGNSSVPVSDTVVFDDTAPTGVSFSIAQAPYANARRVRLLLAADDAAAMLLSNRGDFAGATWEPFAVTRDWDLEAGDALKTVHAKLRDAAGNETGALQAQVTLDTVAPANPAVTIAGGAEYSTSATVGLGLAADGAIHMCLQGDLASPPDCIANGWEGFATSKTVTLSGGDGTKTVVAWFRDAAGNSAQASDFVVVDTSAPASPLLSLTPSAYATAAGVTATLGASGASQMCLWGDFAGTPLDFCASSSASWETLTATKALTLSAGDGLKTVRVKYRDAAKLESPVALATVTRDGTAPVAGAVALSGLDRNGASPTLTRVQGVTVSLSGYSDAVSSATQLQMLVSERSDFADAAWQGFRASFPWQLSAGDGAKTLFVQTRDAAGNASAVRNGGIALDTTAPQAASVLVDGGAEYTGDVSGAVALSLSASGASWMRLSTDGVFDSEIWGAFSPTASAVLGGTGLQTVWAIFQDDAGNSTAAVTDTIVRDLSGPTGGSVVINGGADFSRTRSVTLAIAASDASQMRIAADGTLDSEPWVPFASSAVAELPAGDCVAFGCKQVRVEFRDAAGNVSSAPASDTITLDTTPPTTPLVTAQSATVNASAFCLSAVASTDAFFDRYEVAAGPESYPFGFESVWASGCDGATSFTVSLDQGTGPDYATAARENVVRLRAVDRAGNVSDEGMVVITEDSVPPPAPALATREQSVNADAFSVYLADTSASHVDATFDHYELRGGQFGAFTPTGQLDGFIFNLVQGDGVDCGGSTACANLLELRAVDAAGNVSASTSVTVTEDSVAPAAIELIPNFGEVNAPVVDVLFKLPSSSDPAADPTFDHFQIKGGTLTDFVSVCPEATSLCRPPFGRVGESARYFFHDANRDGAVQPAEIRGLRFELLPDQLDELSVRVVDTAGNIGFQNSVVVTETSTSRLNELPTFVSSPSVVGDRIAYAEAVGTGSEVVIVERGQDGSFSQAGEKVRIPLSATHFQAVQPKVGANHVLWLSSISYQRKPFVRSAGWDGLMGTGDDGPNASCGCGGPNIQLSNLEVRSADISGDRVVFAEVTGSTSRIVLAAPGACGSFCATGNVRVEITDGSKVDMEPVIYGDTIAFLRAAGGVCDLWVVQAGADRSFGTVDDHREAVQSGVSCSTPALFAPAGTTSAADRSTLAYLRPDQYLYLVHPGANRLFEASDAEVAAHLRVLSYAVWGDRLVGGGHSNGVVYQVHAGADGILGTADDRSTEGPGSYALQREVALYNDALVYVGANRGGVVLEDLSENRWLAVSMNDDELLPTTNGRQVAFVTNSTNYTALLDFDTGRLVRTSDQDASITSHISLASNRLAGSAGDLTVWEPGADLLLGTADDVVMPVSPGGQVYLPWQARLSLYSGENPVDLSEDAAAWYDGSAIHVASPGADGVWGGADDCATQVASGHLHMRTSGERLVWDDVYGTSPGIYVREPGAGGVCSNADDLVTNVSAPFGLTSVTGPSIDGDRLVFSKYDSPNYAIYLLEPGPDGRFATTADNVLTRLVTSASGMGSAVISGEWVAWFDYRGGASEVFLLHLPDRGWQNVTRRPVTRQYFDMADGVVVWSDDHFSTQDLWLHRP